MKHVANKQKNYSEKNTVSIFLPRIVSFKSFHRIPANFFDKIAKSDFTPAEKLAAIYLYGNNKGQITFPNKSLATLLGISIDKVCKIKHKCIKVGLLNVIKRKGKCDKLAMQIGNNISDLEDQINHNQEHIEIENKFHTKRSRYFKDPNNRLDIAAKDNTIKRLVGLVTGIIKINIVNNLL